MKQNSNPYIYHLMKLISCDPFVFPSARWMQSFHQSFKTNSRHSNARVGTCICGSLTWYCDPQKVFILGGGGVATCNHGPLSNESIWQNDLSTQDSGGYNFKLKSDVVQMNYPLLF